MDFDSINFYRNDDGSTDVRVTFKVPRAKRLDASVVDSILSVLDGGEDEPVTTAENTPAETTQGRRSRRSTTEAPAEANPTQGRRGRRGAAPAGEVPGAPEANPTQGRRSRCGASNAADAGHSTEAATASTAATTSPSEPAPAPARRRRQQPEQTGISDADLSKAASQAAEIISPETVMEILGEFGVTEVNKIAQELRQEFLDILNSEIEKQG